MGQGGDYALLPNQPGVGGLAAVHNTSSKDTIQLDRSLLTLVVAGFFSNGRMLLGEANPAFNETLEATFGQFKSKIVDQALQTGGFKVMAVTHLEEDNCFSDSWGGYGKLVSYPPQDHQS